MCYEILHEGKFAGLSEFSQLEIMNGLFSILDIYNVVFIDKKGNFVDYNQQFKNFINSGDYHFNNQQCIADVFKELKDLKLESLLSHVELSGIWSGKLMINSSCLSQVQVHISRINEYQRQNPLYIFLFLKDDAKSSGEENWKELAYTDELTGLSNWRKFREQLSVVQKKGDSFGLLFIDIDNFKEINDQYGHIAGDEFLKLFANKIRGSLGEKMHAFRKSGDEFLVIIEEGEQTVHVANIMKSCLSGDFIVGKSVRRVSVSIGRSIYPSCGLDEESLIHHADLEMYKEKMQRSKGTGKDGV